MKRTLTIEERFGHAKVFEAQPVADMTGKPTEATFNVCIATFDNRADADLFVAIANAEPKYQVELLTTAEGWVNIGHVPTTVRGLAERALGDERAHDTAIGYPDRVRRLAVVRTISEAAPATEGA